MTISKTFFKKFTDVFSFFCLFVILVILATNKTFSDSTFNGIKLWFACILPSVLPYAFITTIMSSLSSPWKICRFLSPLSKRIFNVNGTVLYAFTLSVLSGYPIGAKTVYDLRSKNLISDTEAFRACVLCSTSSPAFLIGSVGNIMFNNAVFGLLLFLCNILSVIFLGICLAFLKRKNGATLIKEIPCDKHDNLLYDSVYSSVISVLIVGGIITVFYILTDILCYYNLLDIPVNLFSKIFGDKNLSKGLILGIFESTKGLKLLSASSSFFVLPVSAFICGFGGISVILQSVIYLKQIKIKTAVFVFYKLLTAVINFGLGLAFTVLFL